MATESAESESSSADEESPSSVESGTLSVEGFREGLARWYHVPVLFVVVLFMFWTRFQNFDVFRRDGEGIWLQAIDSWYHWRATEWTVNNYPFRIGFDPWTGFPDGQLTGQFGTLFDQIVATVAMVIGLGSPGEQDILLAALITVPALAALAAIPVYYIGKRIGNRPGGIAGVLFLALTTGTYFVRTIAGQFQHHAAEALFMSVALLAMMVAVRVSEDEKPIWELVKERNWDAVRRPAIFGVLAGLALSLYIWVWPPGVVLIGIFGVFFVIQLSTDFVRGRSPDHIAFVGVVSMVVTAVGTAIRIETTGFSAAGFDFLPPTFALVVGAGCAFMAWLAREWEGRSLERNWYPVGVAVSIVLALVVLAIVQRAFVMTLIGNISGRIIPFGYSPGAQTVAEVQPPENISQFMYDQYGMAFFLGVVAYPLLIFRPLFGLEQRGEHVLVVVWTLFLFSMAITQARFNYYFVLAVAVLNAHLVGFIVAGLANSDGLPSAEEFVEQVSITRLTIAVVVISLLFMPLLPPMTNETPVKAGGDTFETGPLQPWTDAAKWEEGGEWVQENTPAVGEYGGANNGDQLEYFGRYDRPGDGSYDYPDGAYGVLSWWDYGHFITTQAKRIPHSNPFQQNVQSSAAFLLAQNETRAELYLDAIAAGESPSMESDHHELRETVENADTEPGIQYVMIDEKSAAGKFGAITQWTGPEYRSYLTRGTVTLQSGEEVPALTGGRLYNTMLGRLYFRDAAGLERYRLVHEVPTYSIVGFNLNGQRTWRAYDRGEWTRNNTILQNRFQQARNENRQAPGTDLYDAYITSSLKTFERVEGATLTGNTTPNGIVVANLTLETGSGRQFEYQQTARTGPNGTFSLTVPYPTAETLGPDDGYANASVVTSEEGAGYHLRVQTIQGVTETAEDVAVPEPAVQNGETVEVTLEPVPDEDEDGNGDSS